MYKLFVIGVAEPLLATQQKEILSDCTHTFCTKRFKNLLVDYGGSVHPISPLSAAIEEIQKLLARNNVAVLASGDPLYFGIGRTLLKKIPAHSLEFHPALSSVQRACALFHLPWDDAKTVSLHGRNDSHLTTTLLQTPKTIIFTDSKNSPDRIAGNLLEYFELIGESVLPNSIEVLVAEDIGLPTENIFRGTLGKCRRQEFSPLNIMALLIPSCETNTHTFGLSEDDLHHSRGLITKNEVRAATLHQLQLPRSGILWDIGAGSGSVSIEAARTTPDITIYAIEHKAEEIENIKKNILKYRCYNIIPVFGKAPQALESLPAPDRIFIGGSGGSLRDIVQFGAEKLEEGGRIVINGVIKKTLETAPQFLQENDFFHTETTINVTRKDHSGNTIDFNPITIITGYK